MLVTRRLGGGAGPASYLQPEIRPPNLSLDDVTSQITSMGRVFTDIESKVSNVTNIAANVSHGVASLGTKIEGVQGLVQNIGTGIERIPGQVEAVGQKVANLGPEIKDFVVEEIPKVMVKVVDEEILPWMKRTLDEGLAATTSFFVGLWNTVLGFLQGLHVLEWIQQAQGSIARFLLTTIHNVVTLLALVGGVFAIWGISALTLATAGLTGLAVPFAPAAFVYASGVLAARFWPPDLWPRKSA